MTKYQIFISSTYDDLKTERAQVIKAVLEMGHIPVGMEMFSAADEEQWKVITRQIDETDYYVVIVAHRYGSMTGGISYTEKEFDYAVSKGIPVLGFVIDSSVEALAKHIDKEKVKIVALEKFKGKVKQRPVGFWKSADDLHGKVSIALMKAFHTVPRIGWTRATATAGPEVMQELSRLSKENSELRLQLGAMNKQEALDRKANLQSLIETLKNIPQPLQIREEGKDTWDIEVPMDLFEIFSQLSTEMMVELSVTGASFYLGVMNHGGKSKLCTTAPVGMNHVSGIFADLASFGLVEPSKKKHSISDTEVYWSLTNEGFELLKHHRATQLEARAAIFRTSGQPPSYAKKALKTSNKKPATLKSGLPPGGG